jgi:glycosyltransferase involved in cell wall biosynthesis
MIGRIAPQKEQAEFLRAARILAREFPDCEFVVCGAPVFGTAAYAEEVRQLAEGLPVEFIDWRDGVWPVLSSLDVMVAPSLFAEATTRVVLEAFSAGVPVVAFATGGIPEVVEHGRTGLLADQPTPEALARAVRGMMRSDLEKFAAAAKQEWLDRFTLAEYRKKVLETMAAAAAREPQTAAPRPWPQRPPRPEARDSRSA